MITLQPDMSNVTAASAVQEHKELLLPDVHRDPRPLQARPRSGGRTSTRRASQRLKDMPVWNEATRTEAATAVKVQSLGDTEKDPLLAEAISLQGYEEGRHAEVIQLLTRHYGIPVDPVPAPGGPEGPDLGVPADGLRRVPRLLLRVRALSPRRARAALPARPSSTSSSTIMQEEARHILFIVNWAAYLRARRPLPLRPAFDARRGWNIVAQAFDRVKGALAMAGGDGKEGRQGQEGPGRRARRDPGRLHAEAPRDVRRLLAALVPRDSASRRTTEAPRSLRRAAAAPDARALGREDGREGAAEGRKKPRREGREGGRAPRTRMTRTGSDQDPLSRRRRGLVRDRAPASASARSGRPPAGETFDPGPCFSTRSSAAQASRTGSAVNSIRPRGAPRLLERADVLAGDAEVRAREGEDLRLRDLRGQVAAPLLRVHGGVLQDVDELQRLAEGRGALAQVRGDRRRGPAGRAGRAPRASRRRCRRRCSSSP